MLVDVLYLYRNSNGVQEMANKEFEFKVRKWSDTNARPFDVVLLDYLKNNQHYQPNVEFSTEALANQHLVSLQNSVLNNPDSVNFIRDHWPVDGGIE
ncbi:hypothetical protein pEaSNUABM50_00033 [Erwinia phage pEa_SNUABM_50]|uniref:Uncharacterized protein n=4 Tax=Eneladusvirus BF TaxID=2560751 RepID=A0A7L8ZMS8_9CAUD|nr:hypothetical protein FDH34_gp035 [Serratia phage BF]QOI70973.1 hypothetical protein pEaSNUABM12_00035 [Erwinia phage pEa_SNUABM_12]QOI71518.1 hypothetical protein pEaSNUABM47_00034 [Erwinia phage pEa_SNUABM_47]QOI72057.1 hypothetical protein pEaSNUABM50_00033 [Erwinia phage pEa_SNUABM_50]QXO11182.1 hypothetical protein pEaSNUABM19_00036 [Erwinia phage pEa_SNUABM_19]QXO11730.1 hypothetical protein pEaSNUABM44_00034 [Erwinia phage pEa_SNUABM_44]QXO12281.1 hypothetical protein pEaSNUABM49_000